MSDIPEISGEFPDRYLVEHLVLSLRASGVEQVLHAYTKIQRAFWGMAHTYGGLFERAVGFVPVDHPLFGTYRCVDDALSELADSGAIELYRHMLFVISIDASKRFVDEHREGKPAVAALAKEFVAKGDWR